MLDTTYETFDMDDEDEESPSARRHRQRNKQISAV
jgi:hypothetical protein